MQGEAIAWWAGVDGVRREHTVMTMLCMMSVSVSFMATVSLCVKVIGAKSNWLRNPSNLSEPIIKQQWWFLWI